MGQRLKKNVKNKMRWYSLGKEKVYQYCEGQVKMAGASLSRSLSFIDCTTIRVIIDNFICKPDDRIGV